MDNELLLSSVVDPRIAIEAMRDNLHDAVVDTGVALEGCPWYRFATKRRIRFHHALATHAYWYVCMCLFAVSGEQPPPYGEL
jgi:hypothetical protein